MTKKKVMAQDQKEAARIRTAEWYKNNKSYAKAYRKQYYSKNLEHIKERVKEWARQNPRVNKDAVARWRQNNPDKDPVKYRVRGKLRAKCLELLGNICPMCNREYLKSGYLRPILHHLQYEPEEHVVALCYQCHNIIHGRRAYGHPFMTYAGEMAPYLIATAVLDLYNRFVVIKRLRPRKLGGNRRKESGILLVDRTINKIDLDREGV